VHPTISQRRRIYANSTSQDDGTFVLYYSASNSATPGHHCIGTATSKSVTGPFTPNAAQLACPTDQGGAIDASGFHDTDGTRYVVYKIDGNSLGHGGTCGNTNDPVVDTPIMVQTVGSDAVTPQGGPSTLLHLDPADGPDIEAPSLTRSADGTYFLFFSSNCYSTPQYDVSYATSSSPTGGFAKSGAPLYQTGNDGLTGPGGADADADATHVLFHGLLADGQRRGLYAATVGISGTTVTG